MVAGAIALCGAFGGVTRGKNASNPKGMYENAQIVNTISKSYLRGLGLDPLGQYPLPDVNNLPIPTDWRRRVERIMRDEGYAGGPWYYKGCKMAAVWPIWAYHFPRARWIIVRRKAEDIISSCVRTGFMRAFRSPQNQKAVGANDEREGWAWWVQFHLEKFREMQDNGLNCKVVYPEKMVAGDYSELMDTIAWCGLEWNPKVLSWVDPKLWKARHK